MVTYLVAKLCCPRCGGETEAEMYTKLLTEPGVTMRWVNDPVDADPADFERAFHRLRERDPGEPFRVLLPWGCSHCGYGNWALVTIDDNKVQSMEPLVLNKETLKLAQYIVENLAEYFELVTGEEFLDASRPGPARARGDFAAIFAAHLPDAPDSAPSIRIQY